jgi:hypothetical protein
VAPSIALHRTKRSCRVGLSRIFSRNCDFSRGLFIIYLFIINLEGRSRQAAYCDVRGGGAQRPFLRVNEPKTTGARSAAITHLLNYILYVQNVPKYCSLRASVSVKNNGNSIVRPHLPEEFLNADKHRIIKSSLMTNGREGVLLLFTLDEYKQQM